MIDVYPEVKTGLLGNSSLITILGGPRVYQQVAPRPNEFPRISFFEMTNFDTGFADDTAIASEIHLQIDIWSKGSTTDVAGEVDKTMKALGYKRTGSADLYEEDTKIFHKALRYSTEREI
ncbi:MAG: DUF3168 domain-containing protein [Syntrophomonas sp.]